MLDRIEASLDRERVFVADASHELRTPLAILRTELELAERQQRSPAELRAAIASAGEEVDRLSRLAEDLLVIARSDQGRLPIKREPVELRASCSSASATASSSAPRRPGARSRVEAPGARGRRARSAPDRAGAGQPGRQRTAPRRGADQPGSLSERRPRPALGRRRGKRPGDGVRGSRLRALHPRRRGPHRWRRRAGPGDRARDRAGARRRGASGGSPDRADAARRRRAGFLKTTLTAA